MGARPWGRGRSGDCDLGCLCLFFSRGNKVQIVSRTLSGLFLVGALKRMRLFCLQLEASCLQWSFSLTVDNFSFFHLQLERRKLTN